ncbi:MAG: hypothetical protein JXA94_03560 [Parachlamydiales bacterium]|nr:hypothetical protein [Parachlamydiales bacterium]
MIKKIFPYLVFFVFSLFAQNNEIIKKMDPAYFSTSLGFKYNTDRDFRNIYNRWMVDVIFDGGYWFKNNLSIGSKFSFTTKQGSTLALEKKTRIYEMPLILYFKTKTGENNLFYLSFGPGLMFTHESSYISKVFKAIMGLEIESGLEFKAKNNFFPLIALRYLHFYTNNSVNIGGLELRFGLGKRF